MAGEDSKQAESVVKTEPIKKGGKFGANLRSILRDLLAVEKLIKKGVESDDAYITLAVCIDGETKYVDVALVSGPRDTE